MFKAISCAWVIPNQEVNQSPQVQGPYLGERAIEVYLLYYLDNIFRLSRFLIGKPTDNRELRCVVSFHPPTHAPFNARRHADEETTTTTRSYYFCTHWADRSDQFTVLRAVARYRTTGLLFNHGPSILGCRSTTHLRHRKASFLSCNGRWLVRPRKFSILRYSGCFISYRLRRLSKQIGWEDEGGE